MSALIAIAYMVAVVMFILGLKRLSSPATARSGNHVAALGMLLAIAATLLDRQIVSFREMAVGLLIGALAGGLFALRVRMTAMPQMVALLNGFGGGASLLVAAAEFHRIRGLDPQLPTYVGTTIMLTTVIGAVTFSGSLIAFGKLQELVTGRAVTYPFQNALNLLLLAGVLGLGAWLVAAPVAHPLVYVVVSLAALALGVLLVVPIGGADMPVVISLLNSYSGLAAGMTGFVLNNRVLIVSGALVGASGIILTRIMCRAMNRSLANVLFGAFGAVDQTAVAAGAGAAAGAGLPPGKTVRDLSVDDAAVILTSARSLIIVPGYGMAVAQAQHDVRELADFLERRGVDVKYAIHPVAGRMPGHMNVLLAEANVPYPQLYDLEGIDGQFERTDVALVIGANDVVNPAARHDPTSPIYGMPILDVDKAATTIVLKRSLRPGFAGIDNELYYDPRTYMLFGDAKESVSKLVGELKSQS